MTHGTAEINKCLEPKHMDMKTMIKHTHSVILTPNQQILNSPLNINKISNTETPHDSNNTKNKLTVPKS